MKAAIKASIAALLCGALTPALSAQVNAPVEQAAPGAQALELAGLYLPDALIRSHAEIEYRKNFKLGFDKDPASAKMEDRFPGLYQVALNTGLKAMKVGYDQHLPIAKTKVALVFEREFTPAQAQQLIVFYRSPVGRKTVELVGTTADTKLLADRFEQDSENFAISRADISAMINPDFMALMSKDEIKELVAFGSSPVGRRFQRARPDIEGVIITEMNFMVQSMMAAQQEAISEAVAEHISSFQETKGKNQ